ERDALLVAAFRDRDRRVRRLLHDRGRAAAVALEPLDVLGGDAAVLAGRRDAADLDAELAREPPGCGRREHALAAHRPLDGLDAAGRGRRPRRRWCPDVGGRLAALRLAVTVVGWSGRGAAFLVDHDEHLADRADVAVLEVDLRDRAGARRRQLDGRLVGHHL